MRDADVTIIGAGLSGALLATLLARRGLRVDVHEKRPDPRIAASDSGRSINLALAARGLRALALAGIERQLDDLILPMRGRMIHAVSGAREFQAYGQTPNECIYSVGRAALNRLLIETAAAQPSVQLFFNRPFTGFEDAQAGLALTIAADGAGSAVRASLVTSGRVDCREEWLDHDYKELSVPASKPGQPVFEPDALHIWPRGGFMLIALPNPDASFTATLFLPRDGSVSFASLDTPERVETFFAREFPDAAQVIPELAQDFFSHPQGRMATVHCAPWIAESSAGHTALLLGDAAHAIVPFHGQGMNAAFEDCMALCDRLDAGMTLSDACTNFARERPSDTDAIARMALENYIEMRDTVRDPAFVRMKSLGVQLERRFPDRFIPRYSMVMFHPEIPYSDALRRGAIQTEILKALESGAIDATQAGAMIFARLPPLAPR